MCLSDNHSMNLHEVKSLHLLICAKCGMTLSLEWSEERQTYEWDPIHVVPPTDRPDVRERIHA